MIHHNIRPFKAHVKKEYLYDMDASFEGQYLRGEIFGVSSYPDEALTFQVLLEDGCLFSYIPIQALQKHEGDIEEALAPKDLVYRNNPGVNISVTEYNHLSGDVLTFFRHSGRWMKGDYMLTIDWYEANEQFHLIALQNGQFAALPNHKVKFRNLEASLPGYLKLHQTWKV